MPSINFNLDDVKPLAQALGLGQAPSTTDPIANGAIQTPPMPPQPVPAQAGFQQWVSDPATQKKISDGITPPGMSLLPPPPGAVPISPASVAYQVPPASGGGTPAPGSYLTPPTSGASAPTPAGATAGQNQAPQLYSGQGMPSAVPNVGSRPLSLVSQQQPPTLDSDMAAHPDQYQRPGLAGQGWKGFLRFGIPAALMSASSGLSNMGRGDPTAGYKLLGDQVAQDRAVPAANAAEFNLRNVKPLQDAAALADTQSQTAQRNADADKKSQQADDMVPFTLTPTQAAAINQPALAGTQATMRDYNRLLGMAGNNNTSSGNNANTNAAKVTTAGMNNDSKETIAAQRAATQKAISDSANKTKTLVAQMHDATSRANNQNTNASKGSNGAGGFKVPADVTKRAALASNVLENADGVDEILKRRPEIVGSMGGRYSNVQQMIGSDDPDIQSLGVRIHNIALAGNGAHGVRSNGAVQKTEDELFNNFKSGPNGIAGALAATRGSMQTFLSDENSFASTGRRLGGAPPPTGGTPTEGTSKTNSAGDKIVFRGGKWGPA